MKIIRDIIEFFRKILKKESNIKLLNEPNYVINDRNTFINSLRVNINNKRKENNTIVETLVCVGDGLGIQSDFSE